MLETTVHEDKFIDDIFYNHKKVVINMSNGLKYLGTILKKDPQIFLLEWIYRIGNINSVKYTTFVLIYRKDISSIELAKWAEQPDKE